MHQQGYSNKHYGISSFETVVSTPSDFYYYCGIANALVENNQFFDCDAGNVYNLVYSTYYSGQGTDDSVNETTSLLILVRWDCGCTLTPSRTICLRG